MSYEVIPTFMPNAGVVLNKPQEFLAANYSPYSRNMEFFNDLLQSRLGLIKFDPAVLSGPVLLQKVFIRSGSLYYLFATTKDLYSYDFSTSKFIIITPTYSTGTIEIQAGTPTILRGTGTTWLSKAKSGDFVKIGAGNIDTNATWYTVLSVDSDTQITLTTSAPTTAALTAYVLRQTFTGSATNIWFSAAFVDNAQGEVWIATNGTDSPIWWNATGQAQLVSFSGLSGPLTTAKYITVYKNRVVWHWIVEGGINNKRRNRWSAVANFQSYQDIDFNDLLDEDTEIRGACVFDDFLMIGKEKEWYVGRPDPTTFVFAFAKSSTAEGLKSNGSIIVKKDYVYYYGFDKKFHRWNILRDEIISEEIFPETKDFDQNLEQYITGIDVYVKNQIRWFCPYTSVAMNNYIVVYDYRHSVLEVWDCANANALSCMGSYILQSDLYMDDTTWGEYYMDQQDGYFDDVTYLANAPQFLYCGYDGIVRKCDQGSDDDGFAFNRIFRSTRNNYQMPAQFKRLWRQQFWFQSDPITSVTIKMKKDDSTTYDPKQNVISLINANRDVVKKMVPWDKEAQDFQIEISATNFFAMMGWLSFVMPKRKINS